MAPYSGPQRLQSDPHAKADCAARVIGWIEEPRAPRSARNQPRTRRNPTKSVPLKGFYQPELTFSAPSLLRAVFALMRTLSVAMIGDARKSARCRLVFDGRTFLIGTSHAVQCYPNLEGQ